MTVSMIWAEARSRVIGFRNTIPWMGQVPGELKIFREYTEGSTVLMGRSTWDSLPHRPLSGRRNLVMTRNLAWSDPHAEPVYSIEQALSGAEDLWVIGGGAVYSQFLPLATRVIRTQIDLHLIGDRYAPELFARDWVIVDTQHRQASTGIRYKVEDIRRRS